MCLPIKILECQPWKPSSRAWIGFWQELGGGGGKNPSIARCQPMQMRLVWDLLRKCKHSSGLSKGLQTWEPFDQTWAVFWGNLHWNKVFKRQFSSFAFEIQTSQIIQIKAPNLCTSFNGAQFLLICRSYHPGLCPSCKGPCFIVFFLKEKYNASCQS